MTWPLCEGCDVPLEPGEIATGTGRCDHCNYARDMTRLAEEEASRVWGNPGVDALALYPQWREGLAARLAGRVQLLIDRLRGS